MWMWTHSLRKVVVLLFVAAAAVHLTAMTAAAQRETGMLVGTVTDESGAVVPEAVVVVTHTGTGASRRVTTDDRGMYRIPTLLPGLYELAVEHTGFAKWTRRVQITVGATLTVDAQLSLHQTVEVIEVAGAAGSAVNTVTQTIETVIDSVRISELPTFSRDPYALVAIAGNISGADPSGRGVGFAINGQRAASTGILLDGATNTDDFRAIPGQSIPLDAVQEFSVQTTNFTAEQGRAAGGIVNVVTKSGTNEFHGTAFWFGRFSNLASNSFLQNAQGTPKQRFNRNQFGYSVGGPVIKDKLFFFQSTEWIRVRSFGTFTAVVPTTQLLAAANANTQNFFNAFGTLRSDLVVNETYTKATATTLSSGDTVCNPTGPCANLAIGTPMFQRVTYRRPSNSGGGSPQNTRSLVGRMDWNIGPNTTLYGRYALEDQEFLKGSGAHSPYAGFDTGNTAFNNNFLVSLVHTFSPQLVSQSKITFNRLNGESPLGDFPNTPTLFMRSISTRIDGFLVGLPGYLPFNPGTGIPFGGPQNFGQVFQDIGYTVGRHQFRFGGSYVYLQDNRTFGAYANPALTLGNSTVNAMDAFLNGVLLSFASAVDPQGKFPCVDQTLPLASQPANCVLTLPVSQPSFSRSNRYHEFAVYGQDTWRIAPRWTLNLGLRWEYFGVQHNKDSRLDSNYYDAVTGSIFERIRNGSVEIAPNSPIKGLWKKDWNNFAPRLGVAWDVFGNGKTAFRGGYGIAYERNFGNVTFNVIQNPPAYAVISLISGVDVPGNIPISTDIAGPLAGTTGSKALPGVSLRNVDSNIQTAYAHFWSATIEHQFPWRLVFGIDYSGSKGVGLYSLEDPNRAGAGNVFLGLPCQAGGPTGCRDRLTTRFSPVTGGRSNQYTNLNRRGQSGFSNHNAMNIRLTSSNLANQGLNLTMNYTWAHTFDNISSTFSESSNNFNLGLLDPFNPRLDYGNADFDVRHRLSIGAVWDIPYARNVPGAWKYIVDGWQVAPIFEATTGAPFTIWDCTDAFFQVCGRMVLTSAIARKGSDNPPGSGAPATFNYLSVPNSAIGRYVHPLTQNVEFGPYPANMTPRNFFRGPGAWNLDIGIYKTTKVTERFSLQYRAEFFNAFNHANLTLLGSSAEIDNSLRGGPGTQEMVARKDGRRFIQMALRLIF
jgi:outer membrane receptor protein involved in Fe transport